jgi:hypothetical protein
MNNIIKSTPYNCQLVNKPNKVLFYLINPPEGLGNEQISSLLNMNYNMKKSRFKYYERQEDILRNPLFNEENKEQLKDYFHKNASLKFLCNKFYLKIKNRLIKPANGTDIYCDNFEPNKELICIQRKEFIWQFVPEQILLLVNKSLTFSNYMIPEPSFPKNPYTNKLFNKLEMYKIHSFLKKRNHNDMLYFDLFYKYQFDIDEFTYNCFKILKTDTVTETVKGWRYDDEDLLAYIDDVYETESRLSGLCLGCLKQSIKSQPNILRTVKRLIICNFLGTDKNTFTKIVSNLINQYQEYIERETCQCINEGWNKLSDINLEDIQFNIGQY